MREQLPRRPQGASRVPGPRIGGLRVVVARLVGFAVVAWLGASGWAWGATASDRPLERGDLVMPKDDCEIRSGDREVTLKGRIMPFVVQSIAGDQVDLGCGRAVARTVVRVEEADAYYGEWLRRKPRSVDALHLRAILRMHLKNWEGAIADLDAAIEVIPNIPRLYTKRAVAYSNYRDPETGKLKFPDRVRENCDKAFALNRNELWAICVRLRLQAELTPGNSWAQYEDFQRAQFLVPADAETCEVRGLLFLTISSPVQAIRDFDKGIDLEPSFARCYAYRGKAWAMRGRKEDALRDFETAIRLSPKQTFGYTARLIYYQSLNEFPSALADAEKALALAPHDVEILSGFANLLCDADRKELRNGERALKLATEAHRLDPHDWRALSALGAAQAEQGDFTKAEEYYRKAFEMKSQMSPQEAALTAYYINRVRSGVPPLHE